MFVKIENLILGIDRPRKWKSGEKQTLIRPLKKLSNLSLVIDKKWVTAAQAGSPQNFGYVPLLHPSNFGYKILRYGLPNTRGG